MPTLGGISDSMNRNKVHPAKGKAPAASVTDGSGSAVQSNGGTAGAARAAVAVTLTTMPQVAADGAGMALEAALEEESTTEPDSASSLPPTRGSMISPVPRRLYVHAPSQT